MYETATTETADPTLQTSVLIIDENSIKFDIKSL